MSYTPAPMKRNSGIQNQYPGYYNHRLLEEKRVESGLSLREIASKSGVKLDSTRRVFLGEAHQKQVWPIAHLLKVSWSQLHDI